MAIDIILTIIGSICMLLGIAGCILPVLPGVVLSYVGIVLLHLTSWVEFSTEFLIAWAIVVVAVELLNYYIPIWGTKQFGGGKKGAAGCTVGVVAGIFVFPPWGLILLPFAGAIIGELIDNKTAGKAIKAGFGAFIGFVAGTLMQIVVALILAYYFIKEVVINISY